MIEISGWERPNWYWSNEPLLAEFGDRVMDRTHEWDRRWWSPIVNAEHLALRERVGLVENPAFAEWDVSGPGAVAWLESMLVGRVDVPVGRCVYTQMLNEAGGHQGRRHRPAPGQTSASASWTQASPAGRTASG